MTASDSSSAGTAARAQACAHCGGTGNPYTHQGRRCSGLFPVQGELLCERCLDHAHHADAAALTSEQSDGLEQLRHDGPWDYRPSETSAAARLNELLDHRSDDTGRRTSTTA